MITPFSEGILMDRQRVRQLAARFIAEAEADINYGLAEDLDPHHEYSVLVARLRGEATLQPPLSPQLPGAEHGVVTFDYYATSPDGPESPALQPLAEAITEF
jgi:hypothetical protein